MKFILQITLLGTLAGIPFAPRSAAADAGRVVSFEAETGVGYDTNPTRAPRDGYFDQRSLAPVDPEEHGTLFLPVRLRGDYRPGRGDRSFLTRYEARGEFFAGSTASNADEVHARVSPGFEWVHGGQGSRRNTFHAMPFVSYDKDVFYDRDTGDDFTAGAANVSDRYTYLATGAEIEYERRSARRFEFSVGALFEDRNYSEVTGISALDQQRYRLSGDVEFELNDRARLGFHYDYDVRDYDERPSRSLDGRALLTNPPREYTYQGIGTSLRTRAGDRWTFYLDYDHKARQDDFEGYHDYTQDTYGLRLLYRGERWQLRVAPQYWQRDYDHALIFDLPSDPVDGSANESQAYETLELDLRVTRLMRGPYSLVFDVGHRDEDSVDPRYSYVRDQALVGIRWLPTAPARPRPRAPASPG